MKFQNIAKGKLLYINLNDKTNVLTLTSLVTRHQEVRTAGTLGLAIIDPAGSLAWIVSSLLLQSSASVIIFCFLSRSANRRSLKFIFVM